ncbi:hypothetical protein ACJX0J_031346, partial [Zea mays]
MYEEVFTKHVSIMFQISIIQFTNAGEIFAPTMVTLGSEIETGSNPWTSAQSYKCLYIYSLTCYLYDTNHIDVYILKLHHTAYIYLYRGIDVAVLLYLMCVLDMLLVNYSVK